MEVLFIKNIGKLIQVGHVPDSLRKGQAMSFISNIENAFLRLENGLISAYGPMTDFPKITASEIIHDAKGAFVMPTFVDSHTHLVFAAWREQEFIDRLNGVSYLEIAAKGGGILNSAKRLGSLTEDELFHLSLDRLKKCIASGTGAIEIKSGYGLSVESEIKILRVIKRLKAENIIPIKATFLGAHAYPEVFKENHQAYLDLIVHNMLPIIIEEKLADYIDVFCEHGFFNLKETEYLLNAAKNYGLKARIHCNQFTHSGAIELAIKYEALTVDHLELVNEIEIQQLLHSTTLPCLLPAAAFCLQQEFPPARQMIDAGLGLVLATDFNPGTSPVYKMSFILNLAVIKMKMTVEECINSMTINAAKSLEFESKLGSIEVGKIANLIITKPIPSLEFLAYDLNQDWIDKIIVNGKFLY